MDGQAELLAACEDVLKQNDSGGWTRPAAHLYPHQWLWDSCFVAIGLRHLNPARAQREINNLFRGQWKNGMLPNTIMSKTDSSARYLWHSEVSLDSPKRIATSGITQPPLVAEAMVRVGEKLNKRERIAWYKKLYPKLLAYHEWLYRERDPHEEGLVVLVHPWECGLDNTPPWMQELYIHDMPLWIKAVDKLHLSTLFNVVRSDTKFLPAYQRINTVDALSLYSIARRLRRKKYQTRLVLRDSFLTMEDLGFNAMLIRANQHLLDIAKEAKIEVPSWLRHRFKQAAEALEALWSKEQGQYFSRNFATFEHIEQPSIATFLPLYAGCVSDARAHKLVKLLRDTNWWLAYPLPSVPKDSSYFDPERYWQGPTWINTNWMVADGLRRYGYEAEANAIMQRSLELIKQHGAYEYFSPLDGSPAGAPNFSWTAALAIDWIHSS